MIQNIKARLLAEPFDIWTQRIVKEKLNGQYYIYKNTVYYGNRLFIFFKSCVNDIYKIEHEGNGQYKFTRQ